MNLKKNIQGYISPSRNNLFNKIVLLSVTAALVVGGFFIFNTGTALAENLITLTAPAAQTLTAAVADEGTAIGALQTLAPTVAVTTDSQQTTTLPIVWSFTGTFNAASAETNNFTWTAMLGDVENTPSVVVTGTVTVTNFTVVPVTPVTLTSADILSGTTSIGNFTSATLANGGVSGPTHTLSVGNVQIDNGPLANNEYAFNLTPPANQQALKDYFIAKNWPTNPDPTKDYLTQINKEIDGTSPFFYFKVDGTNYSLVDGFQEALGAGDQPLVIDDDYPAGTYTYTGKIGSQTVTVNLTVTEPTSGGGSSISTTVSSVNSISNISVANGTILSAVKLPTSVIVTLSDTTTPSYAVTWDGGSPVYNGSTAGTYTFTGTLTSLPNGVTNPNNKTATVNVIVAAPISTIVVTVPSTVYVANTGSDSNDGSQANPFATIQAAVNAVADGGTVNVAAGTYPESLTITKPVIIIGAGKDQTIIKPSALINSGIAHRNSSNMQVGLLINGAGNVTLQGLTVDGNILSNYDAVVFINETSASIINSVIKADSVFTSMSGHGLAIDSSNITTPITINVTNTDFPKWNRNAIDAVNGHGQTKTSGGGNITLNVSGGIFTGRNDSTTNLQNGINVWNYGGGIVTGTINGVTISDLSWNDGTWQSCAIAGPDNDGLVVSNNTFTNTVDYLCAGNGNIDATAGNTYDGVNSSTATNAQLTTIKTKIDDHSDDSGVAGLVDLQTAATALTTAKSDAVKTLSTYVDSAHYRTAEQATLATAISNGDNAINGAGDTAGVATALAGAEGVINAIKTGTQLTDEETAAALVSAKSDAVTTLSTYVISTDYRTAEQATLATAISNGDNAINGAGDTAGVATALSNAELAINAITMDALNTEIGLAQTALALANNNTGNVPGNYTQDSVNTLNAAITAAGLIKDTQAQSDVTDATNTLTSAVAAFTPIGPSNVDALTTAKTTAQGLITANAPESTTPGDHVIDSLTTLTLANTAADATVASPQLTVDGQVKTLNTAIDTYNAAIVPASTMTAYNTALLAVVEADYTSATWTTYQGVVTANVVTSANSQTQVNTATANITTAQSNLVTLLSVAQTAAHSALNTALATYTSTNYTAENWNTLTGFKTAGDTAIDAATDLAGVASAQATATTEMSGVAIIVYGGGSSGGGYTPTPAGQVLGASTGPIAGCDARTTGFSVNTGQSCVGNTGTTPTSAVTTSTTTTTTPVGQVLGAESFHFTLPLKKGAKGDEVTQLQNFLNNAGYDCGTADGKFGPKTKTALIKFEIANKLKGDGVVGPKVRAILNQ